MNIDLSDQTPIGHVAVDSGQVLLVDPCYIKTDDPSDADFWKEDCVIRGHNADDDAAIPHGYSQCCEATLSADGHGEIVVAGTGGTAVATSTAYGDGSYPVYRIGDLVVIDFG